MSCAPRTAAAALAALATAGAVGEDVKARVAIEEDAAVRAAHVVRDLLLTLPAQAVDVLQRPAVEALRAPGAGQALAVCVIQVRARDCRALRCGLAVGGRGSAIIMRTSLWREPTVRCRVRTTHTTRTLAVTTPIRITTCAARRACAARTVDRSVHSLLARHSEHSGRAICLNGLFCHKHPILTCA